MTLSKETSKRSSNIKSNIKKEIQPKTPSLCYSLPFNLSIFKLYFIIDVLQVQYVKLMIFYRA